MKKLGILICLMVISFSLLFSDTGETQAKYYENAKVIRVKYKSGETYIKRNYDEALEAGSINLPVFEKDTVGTTQGRIELYLGKLNYLRLDNDTEIELEKIPMLRKTSLQLRLNKGGIYLDIANIDYEKDIEIQTPDCGVFILEPGLYRINVTEQSQTEFLVYEGSAEVSGAQSSKAVRDNQKTVLRDGQFMERPFYFQISNKDEFDLWNNARRNSVGAARYKPSRYLENGYEDYEYELSRNGRWIYHTTYGTYMWIPYNISIGWRPYWHGRWIWNPYYGYVWSSHDPWGWFTHYYGRWHWDLHYGWCWFPGYHWSPAWVSWYWNDYYYGWCPLSRWNRPLIVVNKRWLRNYNYRRRGIPFHSNSGVIVKRSHLNSGKISKLALSGSSKLKISKNSHLAYRGSAPQGKPLYSRVTITNAKGQSVVYKQNSLISGVPYQKTTSRTGKNSVYNYTGSTSKANKYSSLEYGHRRKTTPKKTYSAKNYLNTKNNSDRKSSSIYSSASKTAKSTSSTTKTGSSVKKSVKSSSKKKGSSVQSKVKKKKKKDNPVSYASFKTRNSSKSSSNATAPYSSTHNRTSSSFNQKGHTYYRSRLNNSLYSSKYNPTQGKSGKYNVPYQRSKYYSAAKNYRPTTSYKYKSSYSGSSYRTRSSTSVSRSYRSSSSSRSRGYSSGRSSSSRSRSSRSRRR